MPELFGDTIPRIFTPPLRQLTPETSLGFECAQFAEDVLEMTLLPWQHWLLQHLLELRPDGRLRFRTVILLVARQNGKTTILKVVALYFMYVLMAKMVIGTAQNLDVSEETWDATLELAQSVEELAAEIPTRGGVSRTNGKKFFRLRTGERYKVAAASRRGGRGFTGNLILMDELREHQSWDSWSAVTKTTMAVLLALIIAASNAGDAASVVLRHLRKIALTDLAEAGDDIAREELNDPTLQVESGPSAADDVDEDSLGADDSLGIFEWSAPPNCEITDRSGWAAANPSLGHNPEFTEAGIRSAAKTDPEWTFRTEVLCQWRPTAAGGPFPDGAWEAGVDPQSDLAVADDAPVAICVDVSADRGMAYVGMAARRRDGHVHVQVLAQRAGVEWVIPWLTSPERSSRKQWVGVTWQLAGAPVSSLTQALQETDLPLIEWSGPDLPRASGLTYDLVRLPKSGDPADAEKRRVFHLPQPVLDIPASTAAVKPAGDGWLIDRRKSPNDAAPLVTIVGAVWVLLTAPPPPTPSAYENHDLLVV